MEESSETPRGRVIGFHRESDNPSLDFSEVRGRNVLSKLIQGSHTDEFKLRQAHDLLVEDPNYASAMHAAASALSTEKIHVFVSYQLKTDSEVARTVAQALRELSGGKVDVTLGVDFVREIPGRDYKEMINAAIARAHWFVLLLSGHGRRSEWCLFETGMFRASMISKRINRLICIHHPETALPGPIEEFQAVPAKPERLMAFFDGLFRKEQPLPGWAALQPDADEYAMRQFAEDIARGIKGPSKPLIFNYSVTIDVESPTLIDSAEALERCRVQMDQKTTDLFGKMEPPATWGELIENVRHGGRLDQWLTELAAIIRKTCSNNRFRPMSETFECAGGGRVMRPVVESIERDGGRDLYRVRLLFVEEHYSARVQAMPAHVLAFLNAHRVNSRLRWELIERFVNAEWDTGLIDACANVLSRIERDGQSFSQWDLDALCENYAAPARLEVRRIVSRWRELRHTGSDAADERPGELDRALRNHDTQRVRELMYECAALVSDFLRTSDPVMQQLTTVR